MLFTDGRYTTQARAEVDGAGSERAATRVEIVESNVVGAACELAVEAGVVRCGFDSAVVTVAGLEAMRAGLPASVKATARKGWFVAMPGLVAGLREVKDEVEQDAMRAAAALGCRLFDERAGACCGGSDGDGSGDGARVYGAAGRVRRG